MRVIFGVFGLSVATVASAGFEPYLGWATVGDPGNRTPTIQEAPRFFPPFRPPEFNVGSVDYEFRISKAEIVIDQYMDFLDIYQRYHYDGPGGAGLTGSFIFDVGVNPDGTRNYDVGDVRRQVPIQIAFPVAQAYCNWLHNDRGTDFEDFTTGAYDLQDFFASDNDADLVPVTREPDARYWVPSFDELTKASFWDPEKNDGEGGYWRYGISSDAAPIYDLPENGGQSSAATDAILPVGSYPDATSPWGLFDVSGTYEEWSSGVVLDTEIIFRTGSGYFNSVRGATRRDTLGEFRSGSFIFSGNAFRIATNVPAPGTLLGVACLGVLAGTRRRR